MTTGEHTAPPDALVAAVGQRAGARHPLLRPFVYVFLFSLVIRVLWTAHATITPIGDHYGYDRSARHWLDTGEFSSAVQDRYYRVKSSGGVAVRAYRTPGYIGFVALLYWAFGHNWGVVGAAQAVLGALTSGLLVILAARMLSVRAAVIAGLLHACWPTAIVYVPVIAGDNLIVFLLIAGLTCLTGSHVGRWRWVLATSAGLCMGLMMLVRASSLFVLPGYGLLCLYNPLVRVWRPRVLLLVIVLTGAIMTPWFVRNARLGYGFPLFSTQGGYALWWGNNWRTVDGGNPAPPRFPGDSWMPEVEQHHFFQQKAMQWIRENPGRYLALSAVRLVRLFGTQADVWAAKYFWPTEENDRLVCAVYWKAHSAPEDIKAGRELENRNRRWHQHARVVVAPIMLLAVLLAFTRPRAFAFVLLPLWSYALGLALTVFAGRYRVTSDPLILVCLAALLVDLIWGTRETGRGLTRWAKLALIVLAVSGSALAHWRGWDAHWYTLPMGPAPQPAFEPAQSNLVALDLQQTDRTKPVSSGGCQAELVAEPSALRVHLKAQRDAASAGGGLRLPIDGLRAARLAFACDRSDLVRSLVVRALDAQGETRLSWTWKVAAHCPLPPPANPATVVLVPSEPSSYFVADVKDPDADWNRLARVPEDRLARAAQVGEQIRELRVVAHLKPGADVNLFFHELTVALPSAATSRPARRWRVLDWPTPDALKVLATKACRVESAQQPDGIALHLRGTPEAEGLQYGGVALPTSALAALRLRMSFDRPENIDALIVSGLDGSGEQRLRWEYPVDDTAWRLVPGSLQDWLLVPGERGSGFVPLMSDTGVPAAQLHIIVRIRPGTELSATLHRVEIVAASTSGAGAKAPTTSATTAPAEGEPEVPLGD